MKNILIVLILIEAVFYTGCHNQDEPVPATSHRLNRFTVTKPNGDISSITEYKYDVNNKLIRIVQKLSGSADTNWVTYFENERIVSKASSRNITVYSYVHFEKLVKEYLIYKNDTSLVTLYFLDDNYNVIKEVAESTTDTIYFNWENGNNTGSIENGIPGLENTFYENLENPYANENKFFRYSFNGGINFKNKINYHPDSQELIYKVIESSENYPLTVEVYYNNKFTSNIEYEY